MSYNKLLESEFDNIVSKSDKLQDFYISQLKLEVHNSYKNDEKITTDFEPINNEDVIKKIPRRKIIRNKRSLINIRKRLQRF